MDGVLRAAHGLSRVLVWIGGGMILLSAFLVTAEVFMRKLLNVSIGGADELSGYAFCVATSLSFAYVLFERGHIRVDAAYHLFPRGLQFAANLLGLALLIGFAAVVSAAAWGLVADTLQYGSRSITPMRTPLAIPQLPWLFGWLFFIACGVLLFAAALWRALRKDLQAANELIGVKTIEDQIQDETA